MVTEITSMNLIWTALNLEDSDGDTYGDDQDGRDADAFPDDPDEWKDSDRDGLGDNADVFPNDPAEQMDSDNDKSATTLMHSHSTQPKLEILISMDMAITKTDLKATNLPTTLHNGTIETWMVTVTMTWGKQP